MIKYKAKLISKDYDGSIYIYRNYEIQSYKDTFSKGWNIREQGETIPFESANTLRDAKYIVDEIINYLVCNTSPNSNNKGAI